MAKRKRKNRDWRPQVYFYYNDAYCSNDSTIKCCVGDYIDHSDDLDHYLWPYSVFAMLPNGLWKEFDCSNVEGEAYGFSDSDFCVWFRERNDEVAMEAISKAYDEDISFFTRKLEFAKEHKQIAMNNGITYIDSNKEDE